MNFSACDIGNPVYDKITIPRFQRECVSNEEMEDDFGNVFRVNVEWHYYRYDGASVVVYAKATAVDCMTMTDPSFEESVRELVGSIEGKAIFECNVELLHYQFKA